MTASLPAARPPRWCELADALAVAFLVAAVALLMAGAYRDVWFGTTISLGWEQALFAAVAVLAIRHAAQTSPSMLVSLGGWHARTAARAEVVDALVAFWVTRPAVLLVGLLAVVTIGVTPQAAEVGSARDPLATLPARFDSGWYAGIAEEGYEWQHRFDRQQNIAFFPAYPLLMRAAGVVTGASRAGMPPERRILHFIWIGLGISLLAFFWAAWYFSRIAREILDPSRASMAVMLLAAYPFAVFFSAAYTESLFLLAALGAWFHFRHRQWVVAGAWGLLAGLSRPNGCFLTIPLALFALGIRDAAPVLGSEPGSMRLPDRRPPILPALVAASMPGAGMLVFTAYLYHLTGVWFAWSRIHGAWGRVLGAGVSGVTAYPWTGNGIVHWVAANPYSTLNALGLLFALSLIWPVWRRLGVGWGVFVAANVVPPLLAGGLLSMGRITSTLFPLFLALSARLSPRGATACAAAFGLLQGLAATWFFTWRELF